MNTQMITLSEQEMLALWKKVMNLEVPHRECTIEREDGIDLDGLLLVHIRQWYAKLLLTAPVDQLPVEELCEQVAVSSTGGVVTLQLPSRSVRPVEVRLVGWRRSASVFYSPDSVVAHMQASEYLRGGAENPIAVDYGGRLMLYSLPAGKPVIIDTLRAVVTPPAGKYIFHQSAIDTIPRYGEWL